MKRKLTPKQIKFCNVYVETGNASEAYRSAYNCKNMRPNTINRKAKELLDNGKITARIAELQAELQKRSDITKDETVKALANIIRTNITDIIQLKGNMIALKNLEHLPDDVLSAIESVKCIGGNIEVKLFNKINAIDRLSRIMGWESAQAFKIDFNKLSDEEIDQIIKKLSE